MIPKIKVLYVEDDKQWQEIVREIITMLGYQIDIASTSKEAMFKLKRSTYHIALLDKRLNEDDPENDQGLAIATVIAGLGEGTKIIVYTSHGNIDDAREAFREIKVSDFIGKDKPISEIRNALKESAKEAILEFKRPARMPTEILVAKGDALNQFLSRFPPKSGLASNVQNLGLFAKRLLMKYRPLLADRSDAKLITVFQSPILQIRFWSKMIGSPIAVWFGMFNNMKAVLEKIDSEEKMPLSQGVSNKVEELFDFNVFPDFGGAIFELNGAELEEFESQMEFHL